MVSRALASGLLPTCHGPESITIFTIPLPVETSQKLTNRSWINKKLVIEVLLLHKVSDNSLSYWGTTNVSKTNHQNSFLFRHFWRFYFHLKAFVLLCRLFMFGTFCTSSAFSQKSVQWNWIKKMFESFWWILRFQVEILFPKLVSLNFCATILVKLTFLCYCISCNFHSYEFSENFPNSFEQLELICS